MPITYMRILPVISASLVFLNGFGSQYSFENADFG